MISQAFLVELRNQRKRVVASAVVVAAQRTPLFKSPAHGGYGQVQKGTDCYDGKHLVLPECVDGLLIMLCVSWSHSIPPSYEIS